MKSDPFKPVPMTVSRAAIRGHPIHPMLIPFPVALLVGALLVDIAWLATGNPFWPGMSLWLIGAGIVTGVAAAAFGMVDFVSLKRVRHLPSAWTHALGNIAVLLLAAVNLGMRLTDPAAAVLPWGLALSLAIAALLAVTAWVGGELVYRHGIGVTRAIAPQVPADQPPP